MYERRIGDDWVSAIGLGEMRLSIEGRPPEEEAITTIHAALDAGVTLIDTADAYAMNREEHGHGERLVARALAAYPGSTDEVLVATKGGLYRPGDGSWRVDGRPEYLKQACKASLKALGVSAIGLYQLHRPDPKVPYAESVGALAELLEEGKIKMAGISNANVEQIAEAQRVLGGRLVSVQNQFSPKFRSSHGELAHCQEHGIAFLAWSPLGGIGNADALVREHPAFAQVADAHEVSPQQVALAWILSQGNQVIAIPGSRRPTTTRASASAGDIALAPDEIARLDAS